VPKHDGLLLGKFNRTRSARADQSRALEKYFDQIPRTFLHHPERFKANSGIYPYKALSSNQHCHLMLTWVSGEEPFSAQKDTPNSGETKH
jgi:hypothetical protein